MKMRRLRTSDPTLLSVMMKAVAEELDIGVPKLYAGLFLGICRFDFSDKFRALPDNVVDPVSVYSPMSELYADTCTEHFLSIL